MSETELPAEQAAAQPLITKITVGGFKSIREEQTVTVRPLTLLAGKNSAGKSSLMQPLLLLKQSVESAVDPPGGVLLNGPNVKFTSANQLLSWGQEPSNSKFWLSVASHHSTLTYRKFDEHSIRIFEMKMGQLFIRQGMNKKEIYEEINKIYKTMMSTPETAQYLAKSVKTMPIIDSFPELTVRRSRCFLELLVGKNNGITDIKETLNEVDKFSKLLSTDETVVSQTFSSSLSHGLGLIIEIEQTHLANAFSNIIHLPGLRGNPERQYQLTNWGDTFPGTFEKYAASVLHGWQERNQPEMLAEIEADLIDLDLANYVRARAKDGTSVEVELKPGADGSEIVSLADVGLGVSQCLPVVVALHVAKPHQLVYLEQPEIHLHPRAQVKLAGVIARAVRRGVRMIVETHSDHLLLGIQTLVAQGQLEPEDVGLNWFAHDAKERTTRIHSAEVDKAGGFGAWPEDFSDVDMESRAAYLDAAAAQRRKAAAPAT